MKCTQRLYLTADRKKVVEAGHKKAATLYAVPGDEIPQEAHDRFGLVDGHLKGFDPNVEADGEPEAPPPSEPTIVATQALFHSTAAPDTLVPEGHDEAGKIYAKPGDLIPQSAHDGFGLVDGALPAAPPVGGDGGKDGNGGSDKEQKPGFDKEQKPDGDKDPKSGADKAPEGMDQAGARAGAQA